MTATDYFTEGRAAFTAGVPRLVPRDVLVELASPRNKEAAKAWYRGWDAANVAAPVDERTTAWSIDEVRAVLTHGFTVLGGDRDEVCDFLDLPETGDHPSQATVPAPSGIVVDHVTANLLVTVYDKLGDENRARFTAMPITTAADVAWKLVK